jgi:hypothetical protein
MSFFPLLKERGNLLDKNALIVTGCHAGSNEASQGNGISS